MAMILLMMVPSPIKIVMIQMMMVPSTIKMVMILLMMVPSDGIVMKTMILLLPLLRPAVLPPQMKIMWNLVITVLMRAGPFLAVTVKMKVIVSVKKI